MALAAALFGGTALEAQDWATRALCDVAEPRLDEAAFAPASLKELQAEAGAMAHATGRFWRVVAPSGAVSHLWGTMHSADPRILALPDLVEQRIAEARLVALEIDPVLPSRAAFDAQFDSADWYRDTPLTEAPDGLDPQVLGWIRLRTEGLGWGRGAPERLTPGALAELLLSDPCNDFSAGVLPTQDGRIQMLGQIGGADILPLEPADRIHRHLDQPGNAGFAVDFLNVYGAYLDPGLTTAQRASQMALYLSGRLGLLMAWDRAVVGAVLADGGGAVDRVNRHLLTARNRAFIATARAELAAGGVFVAVGGFHLPGETGLVALLRHQGFTVTRIPLPGEARP
ncbi:TraB/GumN family protein [Marinovum sp.]|uniref:TraB/GumN family protein n=1 Tax=Marinovum sp. TaxID=2024839 RepID=UPI002B2699F6|nr:TraB/GumN family protein [Marinovum sp.]